MKRLIVVALLLLAGCTSAPPSEKPTFGGGTEPSVDQSELAAAKKAAGIEDCPATQGTAPGVRALPDITLDCLGGGTPVRLSGLTGTPTVINLWASWCDPCRKELPLLAKADKEYGDTLRVIGIDFQDADPDDAIELARVSGVTYPLLVDRDTETKAAFAVAGLPWTIFVDAQGRMVATERTPFRSYADLTAAIRRHLGVGS
ncbi:TlpA disulfide reductase family protein [Aeromicrobium panaciterrae]|uniref:TlpA family protein disulfide reductase n=1 Tax=Aeromicrobium panaciterrae TaxID=363861 RepID=UPI0031D4AD24